MQYARLVRVAAAMATVWCCGAAFGQTGQTTGPDVIVGDLPDLSTNSPAAVNGVTYQSYAVGTTSCNKGNVPLNWWTGGTDNRHPAISQNIYRYIPSLNRFEQVGQGQLKHGFTALQGTVCTSYFGFSCTSTAGTTLGTGCSDPYSSGLNNVTNSGGPKWQVNAATGLFPYPPTIPTNSSPPRVRLSDLNTAPSGTRYFIEGQYICGDDAAATTNGVSNKFNNASWREIQFTPTGTPPSATAFSVGFSTGTGGVVHREQPAVYAWQAIDPSVVLQTYDVAGDGRFVLACKVTGPVGGLYTYEYALHNLNSHRCAGSFIVPLPAAHNALQNVGFHGAEMTAEPNILPNPADPTSGDWAVSGTAANSTQVSWAGPSYAGTPPVYTMDPSVAYKVATFTPGTGNDHSANVLRWGSLFNFRFQSEIAPGNSGQIAVGLWRPGTGTAFVISNVPTPGGSTVGSLTATCCTGTVCTVATQATCGAGTWGTPGTTCTPDPCVTGTCCNLGACSSTTFPLCAGTWTAGGSCSPNPCPQPTGACCPTGGSACTTTTSAGCASGWQGANTTCASAPCPPANDRCSSAQWLAAGVAVTGNTSSATYTAADGTSSCASSGTNKDVWYKYKPTTSASVTVSLCNSTYDTALSVHSGTCGAFTELGCNDDSTCNGSSTLQSNVTASMTAGQTYFIRVSGYSTNSGVYTILISGGGGVIPTGACCASGACSAVTQDACTSGTYQGDGTACSPNPCPQPNGACCSGTTCSVTAPAACSGTFQGSGSTCGVTGNPTTCCPANYNGTGGLDIQDIFDFLNGWFANAPGADFNHTGGTTVQDIFDFLAAWFAGC